MRLKKSTQWDVVGLFSAMMTFIYFLITIIGGPLQRANPFLLGLANPPLMIIYLLFSYMAFIYGYLESKKEQRVELAETGFFINIS
jgi:hypothetical protein